MIFYLIIFMKLFFVAIKISSVRRDIESLIDLWPSILKIKNY